MNGKIDWKPIWVTTVIVTIATIVIGQLLQFIEPNLVNAFARAELKSYFSTEQSVNFPLLFLLVELVVTFVIVMAYRMLLPQLSSNWISRGLLLGAFLFLVSDLPNALLTGYTTIAPVIAARGMLLAGLINKLINGCILTYCFDRFASDYQKDKSVKATAPLKGLRS